MTSNDIIKELKTHSNPKNVEGMARFGIRGKNILGGPNVPTLRKMTKNIIKTAGDNRHQIALELWNSQIHEAQLLASMIDDPTQVTEDQINQWVQDFDSWDVCDQVCLNLFDKVPEAIAQIPHWAKDKREFVKRTAFSLIAVSAWHDKTSPDAKFEPYFHLIVREATDERNFVRKAVNWALRQMGKKNDNLKMKAIEIAEEILKKYPDSKAARWIANDALRELKVYRN